MVFLTPGFRHPSYFEHAYKARLLGFPLVEPADLTVRERRLFLKTLAGLRKIDGVVCRLDDETSIRSNIGAGEARACPAWSRRGAPAMWRSPTRPGPGSPRAPR
jgi:hypothetical protein